MAASNPFATFRNDQLERIAEAAASAVEMSAEPSVAEVAQISGIRLDMMARMPWAEFMTELGEKMARRGLLNEDELNERANWPQDTLDIDFSCR